MCGIAGWVDWDGKPPDFPLGETMARLLEHRGPDDGSCDVLSEGGESPTVAFAHRRLAVIDLTDAASQPQTNEDGAINVIFNGEIYNFARLRKDLQAKGHEFRSFSDTEVIVHAYEAFGDDFLQQLDGMFSIALWDAHRRRLVLARDRVGKKPLYYAWDGRRLAFASEIRALRVCPWVDSGVDPTAIPEFLSLGYIPWPRTMHAGIRQLPPGSFAISEGGNMSEPQPFWEPPFAQQGRRRITWDGAVRETRDLLSNAIERRLVADVPVGVLLSGGLDSSGIVALMKHHGVGMKTFTLGFDDEASYDERRYARIVADRFGTDHREVVLHVDAAQLLDRIVWFLDQPFADSSALPTYLIARAAREQVTVVLTGDGGDETFGGYERFSAALLADRMPSHVQQMLSALSRLLPRTDGYFDVRTRLERFAALPQDSTERQYSGWVTLFPPRMLKSLLSADLRDGQTDGLASHRAALEEANGVGLLHRLLHLNMRTYLHDDLLVKTDRMTMANSLEARSPFLDKALVEFAATLPPEMKTTLRHRKRILKRALEPLLPTAILGRRKHGFGVPVDHWFQSGLRSVFQDYILSPGARTGSFLDTKAIDRLYRQHLAGHANHGARLWALLTLESWLRLLERNPEQGPPPEAGIEAAISRPALVQDS